MLHCATTSDKVSLSTPVKFSFYLISIQATAKRDSMTPVTCLFLKPFVAAMAARRCSLQRQAATAAAMENATTRYRFSMVSRYRVLHL